MSKGARRKRQTRPWQNADAMRDISHLLGASSSTVATDLEMDGYEVSEVPEHKADKDYICPDCGNVIPQGEAHVVVFPEDDPDLRRHWHRHCWRLEVRRSGGPREDG